MSPRRGPTDVFKTNDLHDVDVKEWTINVPARKPCFPFDDPANSDSDGCDVIIGKKMARKRILDAMAKRELNAHNQEKLIKGAEAENKLDKLIRILTLIYPITASNSSFLWKTRL